MSKFLKMGRSQDWRKSVATTFVGLALVASQPAITTADAAEVSGRSMRYFEQAQEYETKGDTASAIIEYKNAIRTDGNNLEARIELAEIYNFQLNGVAAEKELIAARSRGIETSKILIPLATALIIQGKHEELLKELPIGLADDKSRIPLAVYRAQAALAVNKLEQAEDELAFIQNEAADREEVWLVRSWLAGRDRRLDEAMQYIDRALQINPKGARSLLQKADILRQTTDFEGSVPYYTKVLEIEPFNSQARLGRAYSNLGLKKSQEVVDDADIVLERIPNESNASYLKSVILAREGKSSEALDLLTSAYRIETLSSAMYLMANLHLQKQQMEQARAAINKYLSSDPTSLRGLVVSATIHLRMNEPSDAVDILERVHEAAPEDLRVIVLLANGYSQLKRYAKSAELYDLAIQNQPASEDLRYRAAQTRLNEGQIDLAISGLEAIVFSEMSSRRAAVLLFLTHLRREEIAPAANALDEIERLSGKSAETENFRASLALLSSEFDQAETHLRKAMSLDSEFVTAKINLARLFERKGMMDESKRLFEEVHTQKPGYMPAITGLIAVARQEGRDQDIIVLLDRAVADAPTSKQAHMQRVGELLTQGRPEKALVATRDFMEALPNTPEAFDALAKAQIANRQFASAIVTYRKLENMMPDNPLVRIRLAEAMIAAEDPAAAKLTLERSINDFPDYDAARRMRILLERDTEGTEQAENLAESLYDQVKDPLQKLLGLGNVLMAIGNEAEGLKVYRRAYQSSADRGGLLPLYRALDRTGNKEEAERVLRDWMDANPDDSAIQSILSSWLIQNGRFEDAIVETEKLQRMTPEDPIVLNNLAWLYENAGRHDEAILLSRQAHTLSPHAGELADTYGWILFTNGQKAEGLQVLEDAAQRLPRDFEVQYHYAAALADAGKTRSALGILNRILDVRSTFPGKDAAIELREDLLPE